MPMLAMTPEESVLFRLARKQPLAGALRSCDAGRLVAVASRHKVLSPLADRLEKDSDSDPAWRRVGAALALAAERENALQEKALAKSVALLESAGIRAVVMKGISLAMGRPRDSGDVDLLIAEGDATAAISRLEASGYAYAGFERNQYIRKNEYRNWRKLSRWSIQYEFLEPETGVLIELHTAFFETDRVYGEDTRALRSSMPEFMARGAVDPGTGYRFLALEDRALLLALHSGMKRSPSRKSFVMRHILDLDALIGEGLNWGVLAERAHELGCSHHLLLLLRLYEDAAGLRLDRRLIKEISSALDARADRAVRSHLRCIKGLDSYSALNCIMYSWLSAFAFKSSVRSRLRAALVLPLFIVPPYRIAESYGLPDRSRWIPLFYLLEPIRLTRLLLKRAFGLARVG